MIKKDINPIEQRENMRIAERVFYGFVGGMGVMTGIILGLQGNIALSIVLLVLGFAVFVYGAKGR